MQTGKLDWTANQSRLAGSRRGAAKRGWACLSSSCLLRPAAHPATGLTLLQQGRHVRHRRLCLGWAGLSEELGLQLLPRPGCMLRGDDAGCGRAEWTG